MEVAEDASRPMRKTLINLAHQKNNSGARKEKAMKLRAVRLSSSTPVSVERESATTRESSLRRSVPIPLGLASEMNFSWVVRVERLSALNEKRSR